MAFVSVLLPVLQSPINTKLPIVYNLLCQQENNELECKVCGVVVRSKGFLSHFETHHPDFDHVARCLVCLKKMNYYDYERHVYECVKKKKISVASATEDQHVKAAIALLSSYEPGIWHHVIVSKGNVGRMKDLVEQANRVEISKFSCWCKSRNTLEDDEVPANTLVHHAHFLIKIPNTKHWEDAVWSRLRGGYKKMAMVEDVTQFGLFLISFSQTRVCNELGVDSERHFNIQQKIHPKYEFVVKLSQPDIILEEIKRVMHFTSLCYFEIDRTFDRQGNAMYFTPLAQAMEKIDFLSLPIFDGTLKVKKELSKGDDVLLHSRSGYLILEPNDCKSTLKDAFNLIMPNADLTWKGDRHNTIHDIFQYVNRERCMQESL